jgi:hypothetical protein
MPFTPDNDLEFLFPEELVPWHIKEQLPPELHVRQTSRHLPFFVSSIPYLFLTLLMRPPVPTADSSIGFDRLHARAPLRAQRANAGS